MVLFKTVGRTVAAMVRFENNRKRGKSDDQDTQKHPRPLYPPTNPQKIIESVFIDPELQNEVEYEPRTTETHGTVHKSPTRVRSKSDLVESFGSEGGVEFRHARQRRRNSNFQTSSNLTRTFSIKERSEEITPLEMFQKAVKKIIVMLRVVGKRKERPKETDRNLLSWTTICDDLGFTRTRYNNIGLSFDPTDFKVKKKGHISNEAIETLGLHPRERTAEQLRHCLVSLNTTLPAFSEFPKNMQTSLVQVGWYEKFEAGRVIIRQGQLADNFYLILSGQAVVTILEKKPKKNAMKHGPRITRTNVDDNDHLEQIPEEGEDDTGRENDQHYIRTARILEKGKSFGEIALIHGSMRTATVTCRTEVELLALDRPDFIDIFMKTDSDKEPDHIKFLKSLDIFKGWPVEKIPWNDPKICAFTYVRRETILCHNSNKSELIFVICSGSCRVLKSLPAAKPKLYRSGIAEYGVHTPRTNRTENIKVRSPNTTSRWKTKLEADIAFSRSNTAYSSVKAKTPQQVADDAEEHINIINDIFRKRHVLPPIDANPSRQNTNLTVNTSTSRETEQVTPAQDDQIYIQMTKLGRGDVFGLEQVVLKGLGETTSSSLISEGAECILINKYFFRKHLTSDLGKQMRKKIQPFPGEDVLLQKLQTQTDWEEFKILTVLDFLDFNKHVQSVKWKH